MATEAGAVECPVCGEGFREAPARCFRCETDLSLWWPLDESLRVLGHAAAAAPSAHDAARVEPVQRRTRDWLIPLLLMGGLVGALWLRLEGSRPQAEDPSGRTRSADATPPPPRVTSRSAPGPIRIMRYVVQPGDSLWRIAAALTGNPRRWPELLEASPGLDPARLRPGQELRLVLADDPPAARDEPGGTRPQAVRSPRR